MSDDVKNPGMVEGFVTRKAHNITKAYRYYMPDNFIT
jgi:hypothetical protein